MDDSKWAGRQNATSSGRVEQNVKSVLDCRRGELLSKAYQLHKDEMLISSWRDGFTEHAFKD